jgi:hypothetical protein
MFAGYNENNGKMDIDYVCYIALLTSQHIRQWVNPSVNKLGSVTSAWSFVFISALTCKYMTKVDDVRMKST